jgi:hypothetical protein
MFIFCMNPPPWFWHAAESFLAGASSIVTFRSLQGCSGLLLSPGQTVTDVSIGPNHLLAITASGQVVAAGNNQNGLTHVPAAALSAGVMAVAAGGMHSLALVGGRVVAWGSPAAATLPPALQNGVLTAIAAGGQHSLAIVNGQVMYWYVCEETQETTILHAHVCLFGASCCVLVLPP